MAPEYQLIDDENYASLHDLVEYNTSVGFENPADLFFKPTALIIDIPVVILISCTRSTVSEPCN